MKDDFQMSTLTFFCANIINRGGNLCSNLIEINKSYETKKQNMS